MKKILGLDIGVASVGWGIIDENNQIISAGVRLFEELDSSSNTKRRLFRGARRIKARRQLRIKDMRDLLIEYNIINQTSQIESNPYQARLKGLTLKLSNDELAAAFLQLAKRRGSSLETVEEEKTEGINPKAVLARHDIELKNKFVIEIQLEKFKETGKIRDNENIFRTDDYIVEAKQILKNQKLSETFVKKALQIISRRRHYSEGPGSVKSPTPFGRWRYVDDELRSKIIKGLNLSQKNIIGKQTFECDYLDQKYIVLKNGNIINKKPLNLIDLMRGKCSVYPEEFRAPKVSFSAQLQNLLNDINNMKIVSEENRSFTEEEKQKAIDVIRKNGGFKPDNINGFLKMFKLDINDVVGFRIDAKEKPLITDFKVYKELLKVFNSYNVELEDKIADKIADILTKTQVISERIDALSKIIKSINVVKDVANLTKYTGYHSFSFKAIYQLNEEMLKTNQNQQQILSGADMKANPEQAKLLLDESLILSSVARRAHREALKVTNEVLKEFGNFDRIVIETTREKNTADEKKRYKERQKYFFEQRQNALEILKEAGYSGDDKYSNQVSLKIKLYEEQFGKCAYTGNYIDLHRLITDPKAYEVDHIIPRSISQDNSYNNKVLIIQEVNQLKGNTTPFGYFQSGRVKSNYPISNYNLFKESVLGNSNYQKNARKRNNLLNEEDITKFSALQEFTNRNLVDTSYAARSLMNTIKNYLLTNNIKTAVHTIKGKQTDLFRAIGRSMWYRENQHLDVELNPFNKDRDVYMHHAVDALLIAGLSNQKTFKYLFDLEKTKHETYAVSKQTGEIFSADATEDANLIRFIKNVGNLTSEDIRYSWKIDRKINRSFSDQTIYSTRIFDGQEYVTKKHKNIYSFTKERLEKIFENEKESEKLLVYRHDRHTYELIKQAYLQYKHEKKPLFAYQEEHGKIRKNGKGPIVNNLKYLDGRLGSHIDITKPNGKRRVVLQQISPYRIDVYKNSDNRYKFITIRYSDFKLDEKGFFIDKDFYQQKLEEKKIDNTYTFTNSFNRNEVIALKQEEQPTKSYRFIASKSDRTNVIEVKYIYEREEEKRITFTIGRKTELIKKYAVSPAGRISIVENEKLTLVR